MTALKKIFEFKNFYLIYLLIIILFDFALINLPLTKVFGYEYSVLNSVLIVFLAGIFSIKLLKNYPGQESKKIVKGSLILSFLFFIILPALISVINSFFTIKCSLWDGFLFYLVITVPSYIIGTSLGFLCCTLFKKFRIILFILIYVLILLIPLVEFYFNPQVYFYNPIFAYLPGTIYDEALSVDLKLAIYRLLNLLYFGTMLNITYQMHYKKNHMTKKFLFFLVVLFASLFIYFSPALKYSTNKVRIEKELTGIIESPHFIIHYPISVNEDLIKDIAIHHEYYYKELSEFFKVDLNKKIESFLFLNDEQKKNLFGSANADIAKPWLLQVYISYDDYNSTLKHELAHCFTSAFANGLFKVADNLNPYLIEGAAVAADPIYDENDIHFMAALAYHYGYKIDLKNLFNYLSFFTQTSSISYIYAGSFSKFLIDKYGIEKYRKLYSDLNFKKIYNSSIDNLGKNYFDFIDEINTKGNIDKAYYYFGRKSIFYKVCPRYIADRLNEAWSLYSSKRYNEAKEIFKNIFKLGKNYSALIGIADCESKLNNNNEAVRLLNENLLYYKNTAYYYNIEFSLGDFLSKQYDYTEADTNYSKLINQNPNRKFYYLAQLRKKLFKDSLITIYLNGNKFDKFQVLKKINEKNYDYNSIPVFIDLAKSLNEHYKLFLKNFDKTMQVKDYSSSYAIYRLSIYMLENLDFPDARKMAALSLRGNTNNDFRIILQNNSDKADWIYHNGDEILKQLIITKI